MFGGMHDARLVHDDLEKLCKFERTCTRELIEDTSRCSCLRGNSSSFARHTTRTKVVSNLIWWWCALVYVYALTEQIYDRSWTVFARTHTTTT